MPPCLPQLMASPLTVESFVNPWYPLATYKVFLWQEARLLPLTANGKMLQGAMSVEIAANTGAAAPWGPAIPGPGGVPHHKWSGQLVVCFRLPSPQEEWFPHSRGLNRRLDLFQTLCHKRSDWWSGFLDTCCPSDRKFPKDHALNCAWKVRIEPFHEIPLLLLSDRGSKHLYFLWAKAVFLGSGWGQPYIL